MSEIIGKRHLELVDNPRNVSTLRKFCILEGYAVVQRIYRQKEQQTGFKHAFL